MQQLPYPARKTLPWLTASLAVLALAACNKADQQSALDQVAPPQAALPLTTADLPAGADAPPVQALPSAPPARVARLADPRQRYAYVDRAYRMSDAFADAPPDYSFDYGGVRPWIWRSDNGAYRVLERTPGGARYYYYQPGEDLPFLIRDPDFAYGYDRGQLVVVYDRQGRVLSDAAIDQRADFAGRYLARAAALFQAVRSARREAVARANWIARQRELAAERRAWQDQQAREADWRAFHEMNDEEERDRWADERLRRQAEAARTFQMLNDRAQADQAWRQARDEQSWLQQRGRSGPPSADSGARAQAAKQAQEQARIQAEANARAQQAQQARQAQQALQAQQGQQAEQARQAQQAQQMQADQRRMSEQRARREAQQQAAQREQAALKTRADQQATQAAQARSQAEARASQDRAAALKARADQQAAEQARLKAERQAAEQVQLAKAAAEKARLDQPSAHAAPALAEEQSRRKAAQQAQVQHQADQQAAIAARKAAAAARGPDKGHPHGDHRGRDDHTPDKP